MTVEASMIFPVVIFVMVFLIYVTFMLYGRCILLQDTYILAFRASRAQNMEDPDAFVRQQKDAQFGRKYFGNDPSGVQAWKSGDDIYVSIKIRTRHNAMSRYEMMPGGIWESKAELKAEVTDAPARIRHMERVSDLVKQVSDRNRKERK